MAGNHDRVVILAVLGQHFAVHVLGRLLLEGEVEPRLVEEDAAHQPDEGRKTREEREPVQSHEQTLHGAVEGRRREKHQYARADTHPSGIRDAADAGARRDKEFLLDGLDADGLQLVRHEVGEFPFILRPRQARAYVVRSRFDYAVRFVGILFQFFSHNASLSAAAETFSLSESRAVADDRIFIFLSFPCRPSTCGAPRER